MVAVVAAAVAVVACTTAVEMSSDECRRRDRRTGAATGGTAAAAAASSSSKVAAAYSSEAQRQTPPPFPSVCRLVEKYTMLIERHLQKQNGLTPPTHRKPTVAATGVGPAGVTSADGSSDYSSLSKSAGPSSPALSDDVSVWSRLLIDEDDDDGDDDDEPSDDAEHYNHQHVHRRQHRHDQRQQLLQDRRPSQLLDDDRRFSCELLGSILPGTYVYLRADFVVVVMVVVTACMWRG